MTNSSGDATQRNGPGSPKPAFSFGDLVAARYRIVRVVLCEDNEITSEHLPTEKMRLTRLAPAAASPMPVEVPGAPLAVALGPADEVERERIVRVLGEVGGNQTRAAKALGISRGTLIERLRRYGIKRPQI